MRKNILNKIISSIKTSRTSEVDSLLQEYFESVLNEYDFKFVHNKVYSRIDDKTYDEDCKIIHILAIGFDFYLKKHLPKTSRILPERLNDSTNSVLLKHVSNPTLVNDILKYLHCYIFGLELPSGERCLNAGEFLRLEDMIKRFEIRVNRTA